MPNLMINVLKDLFEKVRRVSLEVVILYVVDLLVNFGQQSILGANFLMALLQASRQFFPAKSKIEY